MKNITPLSISLLGAALIFAGVVGFTLAGIDDQTQTDSAVAAALAAVTPAPTPEPTPIPTPLILAPPECVRAIDMGNTQDLPALQFTVDVLTAYLDHPTEDLSAFGKRVEDLLGGLTAPSDADVSERTRLGEVCRSHQ